MLAHQLALQVPQILTDICLIIWLNRSTPSLTSAKDSASPICERPSDVEVSKHSLRVGAAQDLLIKGYDLAAIMRAGGWSNAETVSRYLRFSQHNIWK